jgi:hypothetical protein
MRYFALEWCGKGFIAKALHQEIRLQTLEHVCLPHVFCNHWQQRRIIELSRSTPEPITMREASVLWAARREATKRQRDVG